MWCMVLFFFKQKTAYEMRISDWSSDVCSSDLRRGQDVEARHGKAEQFPGHHVAGRKGLVEQDLAHLLDRGAGRKLRRVALRSALPPLLLDADVEGGDGAAGGEGKSGQHP